MGPSLVVNEFGSAGKVATPPESTWAEEVSSLNPASAMIELVAESVAILIFGIISSAFTVGKDEAEIEAQRQLLFRKLQDFHL
jgi:hypothetical protein